MSRIGKNPISIPDDVELSIEGQTVSVKGKLGILKKVIAKEIEIKYSDKYIEVKPLDEKISTPYWGMTRTIINNMVKGVSEGFCKTLEVSGVGYRASVDSGVLQLQLGYSHDIKVGIPEDISVKCSKPTEILISGADKQRVGQFASEIRSLRKPEPYKGKGVNYQGEYIRRKEGKKK